MAAQGIHAAASPADVAQQKLNHRRGANNLRTEGVLRPAHGVDNSSDLLHVAILADGGEHVDGLEVLILGNAGDAFDQFRRVARILLLHQLENAAGVLQRQIIGGVEGKGGRRWCS